jgi:hypothetical protein
MVAWRVWLRDEKMINMEAVVAAATWLTEGFADTAISETAYAMLKAVRFRLWYGCGLNQLLIIRVLKGNEEDNHMYFGYQREY